MSLRYFSPLFSSLEGRVRNAAPATLKFRSKGLHRCIRELLSRRSGEEGSLLGEPAFEATFGWRTAEQDMEALRGGLLDERLVDVLASPPEELRKDYEFPLHRRPFTHQLEAWEKLCGPDPVSVMVSSGTGSGKTECFMIPILDRLSRQLGEGKAPLEGVRALFLYPLNALISSQRDRLDAWTRGFKGGIRFCLYNGRTPNSLASDLKAYPNEVMDRTDLRSSPPPILVTNATMLEYMLVRVEDAPIIEASRGKLEWIVLDEAHSYIGSQAAELALLLRRVQMAFGVHPKDIRFVATSATIGDPKGKAGQELRQFLADVAGVPLSQVEVIGGERSIPQLHGQAGRGLPLEQLEAMEPETPICHRRYAALCDSEAAVAVRALFHREGSSVAKLSEVRRALEGYSLPCAEDDALRWLDLLSWTRDGDGTPFLPLRMHAFAKSVPGVWACVDPHCSCRQKSLGEEGDWPFGAVWLSRRTHCECGSPVYEVVTCSGCLSSYLLASEQVGNDIKSRLMQEEPWDTDIDTDEAEDEEASSRDVHGDALPVLLVKASAVSKPLWLDKDSRELGDDEVEGGIAVALHEPDGDAELHCPHCGEGPKKDREFFRSNFIGYPFLMNTFTPTLLEAAPDGEDPLEHPCRGRKMLTFNDSRQGTARNAMRMQIFSETSYVRGGIYRACLEKEGAADPAIKGQIEMLEKIKRENPGIGDGLERELDKLRKKLSQCSGWQSVPFNEMKDALRASPWFDRLFQYYRDLPTGAFPGSVGKDDFARMLVFREFGRRPAHAFSLETMGLVGVTYPKLDNVKEVERHFKRFGKTLQDWKDFLKLCLDYMFRANNAVDFPEQHRKWLGMPFRQNAYVSADAEHRRGVMNWPKARRNRRSRLVRMLSRAFSLDVDHKGEVIDQILEQAWYDLLASKAVANRDGGCVLRPDDMSFILLEKAWLCPFHRVFLDRTLCGISPYLPMKAGGGQECREIAMPIYAPDPCEAAAAPEAMFKARRWLEENASVAALRHEGLWTSLHDSVVERTPFYITHEHSAQIDFRDLERYTQAFRDGDVNVLSCSTTMEMGIDIGGITIVGMNNLPPHPANYLQRAGRAGRRSETRSVVFTMCRENPHEMGAFHDSRWAFDAKLPAPHVSLNSAVIVQRHINAFLLTAFLKDLATEEDIKSMSSLGFFRGEPSRARRFELMAETLGERPSLQEGIRILCRNSELQYESPIELAFRAATAMEEVRKAWNCEYDAMLASVAELENGNRGAAVNALQKRMGRMEQEYLLKELCQRGFLPIHGFPMHIATFDTLHAAQENDRKDDKRNETDFFFRRDLPSRSLPIALSEYAPGNSVAINGLIFESAGITLNWHMPASEANARELQNLRCHWRCPGCYGSGTWPSRTLAFCPDCGRKLSSANWWDYLEPAGFAVDYSKEPSNYGKPGGKRTWASSSVNMDGDWLDLGQKGLVRFRSTTSGRVFYSTDGMHHNGYAVCLACGRVESMTQDNEIPPSMQNHHRLRASRDLPSICSASRENWKIRRGLRLGCEIKTDVLEIQLRREDGSWLDDLGQALPIAIALRDALAERLGIQAEELGTSVEPRRVLGTQERCVSIYIYDRNAAGYASSSPRFLKELLEDACRRLNCENGNCRTACPHCILNFDLRHHSGELDRHRGLEVLTGKWLEMLELSEEAKLFGETTRVESLPLTQAVLDFSQRSPSARVFLHIGEKKRWQLDSPELMSLFRALTGRDAASPVVFALDKSYFAKCTRGERLLLAAKLAPAVSCAVVEVDFECGPAELAVTIEKGDELFRWAFYETEEASLCLSGRTVGDLGGVRFLAPEELMPRNSDAILRVGSSEKFTVAGFGDAMWAKMRECLKAKIGCDPIGERRPIKSITFSDRYCGQPLSTALLFRMLSSLKEYYGKDWTAPLLMFASVDRLRQEGASMTDNWGSANERNKVWNELFFDLGRKVLTLSSPKNKLPHYRFLKVAFDDGQVLDIKFDHGFGFVTLQGNSWGGHFFDFGSTTEAQAHALKEYDTALSVVNGGTVIPMELLDGKQEVAG